MVSDYRAKYTLYNEIKNVVRIERDLCFGQNSDFIHGGSIFYALKLTPEFSKKLRDQGIGIIKNKTPIIANHRWVTTSWVQSEDLSDVYPLIENAIPSIFSNMRNSALYADHGDHCSTLIEKLESESFFVLFAYRKRSAAHCLQDCQLYSIFPKSEMLIISHF